MGVLPGLVRGCSFILSGPGTLTQGYHIGLALHMIPGVVFPLMVGIRLCHCELLADGFKVFED